VALLALARDLHEQITLVLQVQIYKFIYPFTCIPYVSECQKDGGPQAVQMIAGHIILQLRSLIKIHVHVHGHLQ
jgi:hypothetical protein